MNNILISNYLGNILLKIAQDWEINRKQNAIIYQDYFYDLILDQQKNIITFNSSICFKLAKYSRLNSYELALDIVKSYHINKSIYCTDIAISISGNGRLELTVKKGFLSKYLVWLSHYCFNETYSDINRKQADFKYIYIYSRICSILKSAHEQEMIRLNSLDFILHQWNILHFENNLFESLIYQNKSDLGLIKTIIYCLEVSVKKKEKINYLTIVEKMYRGLINWEKKSRIWGEIKQENISLVRARLGLGAIALRYYQNLCNSVFIDEFPSEL